MILVYRCINDSSNLCTKSGKSSVKSGVWVYWKIIQILRTHTCQVMGANPGYFHRETLKTGLQVQSDLLSKTNFVLPSKSEPNGLLSPVKRRGTKHSKIPLFYLHLYSQFHIFPGEDSIDHLSSVSASTA